MGIQYEGAGWLKAKGVVAISPFGEMVANILGTWERGIYHCQPLTLKADWGNPYFIEIKINRSLSTYRVVELLAGCELKNIHMEISPYTFQHLKLVFRLADGRTEKGVTADLDRAKKFLGDG